MAHQSRALVAVPLDQGAGGHPAGSWRRSVRLVRIMDVAPACPRLTWTGAQLSADPFRWDVYPWSNLPATCGRQTDRGVDGTRRSCLGSRGGARTRFV